MRLVFLILAFAAAAWADPELIRGPYVQKVTPSSAIIRWRTDSAVDGRVDFTSDLAAAPLTVGDSTSTTEHRMQLSGLLAGTHYCYAVGSKAALITDLDSESCFNTHPAPGAAARTRVWALGDAGTGRAEQLAVRDAFLAYAQDPGQAWPDFMIMLGDNAYLSGLDSEFQNNLLNVYETILPRTPLWPAIGNHDGISADSVALTGPYFANFSLPRSGESGGVASQSEAYYSYDYGNIHFIVLDSYGVSRAANGSMARWLDADLAATQAKWIIAYWHHPAYSRGSHNSDTALESREMRQNILPMLEHGGVDLVLQGHSHGYERTFLIDGHYDVSSTFVQSMKVDGGLGFPEAYRKPTLRSAHSGTVYVVAGSSGWLSPGPFNHAAMAVSLLQLGSLILDFNGDQLDVRFLGADGQIHDRFAIVKGAGTTLPSPLPTPSATATPIPAATPFAIIPQRSFVKLGRIGGELAALGAEDRVNQTLRSGSKFIRGHLRRGIEARWEFVWPAPASSAQLLVNIRRRGSLARLLRIDISADGKEYALLRSMRSKNALSSTYQVGVPLAGAERCVVRLRAAGPFQRVLIDRLQLVLRP